jgi:magnesium-protoporphyrin O-methyltransferase
MNCCGPEHGLNEMFDIRQAKHDLKQYRKNGAEPTTRALITLLRERGVTGATLLDVGGGVGAIHHELLDAGARAAVHADASSPYIAVAREEAERRGHSERVEFVYGDFVEQAATIARADLVTLDRVICCYPDMPALVKASASRARKFYGAAFPRDRWFLRVGFRVFNWVQALRRRTFRVYLHSPKDIHAALKHEGLHLASTARTFVWQVVVYAR